MEIKGIRKGHDRNENGPIKKEGSQNIYRVSLDQTHNNKHQKNNTKREAQKS